MVCLTREQILAAPLELKQVDIRIPQWGGKYYIREFTGTEYDEWERAIVEDRTNVRAITVVKALRDADGDLVFKDEDVAAVAGMPGRIVDRIATRVRQLNKLGAEDVEIEKGNSEPDQVDNSSST